MEPPSISSIAAHEEADVLPKSPRGASAAAARKEPTTEHSFDAVFDEAASSFMAQKNAKNGSQDLPKVAFLFGF